MGHTLAYFLEQAPWMLELNLGELRALLDNYLDKTNNHLFLPEKCLYIVLNRKTFTSKEHSLSIFGAFKNEAPNLGGLMSNNDETVLCFVDYSKHPYERITNIADVRVFRAKVNSEEIQPSFWITKIERKKQKES